MNDSKTSWCKPSCTGDPATIKPINMFIDCNGVAFSLKELSIDIALDEGQLKKYLDNIDAIVINGIRFAKAGSEKR